MLDGRTLYVVRGQGGNEVVRLTLQGFGHELEATDGEVLTSPRLPVPPSAEWRRVVVSEPFRAATMRHSATALGRRPAPFGLR